MAMPVMIMAAEAFGKTGRETPEELDADKAMLKKIEAIRLEAGRRDTSPIPMRLPARSEEHTSELQSLTNLVCRLLLEKKRREGRIIVITLSRQSMPVQ